MMGAVQPIEDAYFATDFWTFIKKRAPWLIVLFVGELLTATRDAQLRGRAGHRWSISSSSSR